MRLVFQLAGVAAMSMGTAMVMFAVFAMFAVMAVLAPPVFCSFVFFFVMGVARSFVPVAFPVIFAVATVVMAMLVVLAVPLLFAFSFLGC